MQNHEKLNSAIENLNSTIKVLKNLRDEIAGDLKDTQKSEPTVAAECLANTLALAPEKLNSLNQDLVETISSIKDLLYGHDNKTN